MSSISNDWLEMAKKFHFHFELPIAPAEGRVLSEQRRVARGSWMLEELVEFMAAEDIVDQADGLLDFIYFCMGNLVEIGLGDVSFLDREVEGIDGLPAELQFSYRVSFASRAAESIFQFIRSDTKSGQCDFTVDAARIMLRCLRTMKVNPGPLMEILQDKNMAKLWADGKPRFADDGKIVKPPTWEPPEPEMARLINEQVRKWNDVHKDDEIPF